MSTSEKQLVQRARKGDGAAFGELVKRDLPEAYIQALTLTGNPVDARDVVAETYRKAWAAIPNFDGACRFATWRHVILKHAFLDIQRKLGNRQDNETPIKNLRGDSTPRLPQYKDPAHGPEEELTREESRRIWTDRVQKALAKLNPGYRILIKLVDMRQYRALPWVERSGAGRKINKYQRVLRYFRLLANSPQLDQALPYREGLEFGQISQFYVEITSRGAYDQKLTHARDRFAKFLEELGSLT